MKPALKSRCGGYLCFWIICFLTPNDACAGPPTAQELIDAYQQSLILTRHIECTIRVKDYFKGGVFPTDALIREGKWSCRHDGKHWFIDYSDSSKAVHKGRVSPVTREFQYVVNEAHMIHAQRNNGVLIVSASTTDSVGVIPNLDTSTVGYVCFETSAPFFGFLHGDNNHCLPDLLRRSELFVRTDASTEAGTYLLEGKGDYGLHRLWLDSRHGFLPSRIEVQKQGNDKFGAKAVSSYIGDGKGGGLWPNLPIVDVVVIVDNVQFEQIGKGHVMTGFQQATTVRYENGGQVTFRNVCAASEVNTNPNLSLPNPFRISMNIPDDTTVTMRDAKHIPYKWLDGNIVKDIDHAALAKLASEEFAAGPTPRSLRRYWFLMGLNAVVVVAAVFFWVMRRRRRR